MTNFSAIACWPSIWHVELISTLDHNQHCVSWRVIIAKSSSNFLCYHKPIFIYCHVDSAQNRDIYTMLKTHGGCNDHLREAHQGQIGIW